MVLDSIYCVNTEIVCALKAFYSRGKDRSDSNYVRTLSPFRNCSVVIDSYNLRLIKSFTMDIIPPFSGRGRTMKKSKRVETLRRATKPRPQKLPLPIPSTQQ